MGYQQQYATIGQQFETIGEEPLAPPPRRSNFSRMIVAGFTLLAVIGVAIWSRQGSAKEATPFDMSADLEASSHGPRACTLSECFASSCNHEVAPYTCLFHNGGPHGGWYVLSFSNVM